MKRRILPVFLLSCILFIMSAFPAFAGSWVNEDGKYRYYNEDNDLVTGWIEDDDHLYYTDSNGYRKTGWTKIDRSWYYFDEDGVMAADCWIDNYYVGSNGKWTKTR